MHPALEPTDHRPWPLLQGSWLLRQSWPNLDFIHWEINPSVLFCRRLEVVACPPKKIRRKPSS